MVDTSELRFDNKASDIIAEHAAKRANAALRLDIDCTYGRGGPYYMVRLHWTTAARVAREMGLVRCSGPHGVPVFVKPRLWRYLAWHPMRVFGLKFGPIRRLVPEAGPCYLDDMRAWEISHPTIGAGTPAA